MATTQKTIKTDNWTAVVTNPGKPGWSFKVTKGQPTRRQIRRAVKKLVAKPTAKKSVTK